MDEKETGSKQPPDSTADAPSPEVPFFEDDFESAPRPWKDYPIEVGKTELVDFGPLRLWWKFHQKDFWTAAKNPDYFEQDRPAEPRGPIEEDDWVRLALEEKFEAVRLSPRLPDRPVVAQPETPLEMRPGSKISLYIRCPLRVRIDLVGKQEMSVGEVPSVLLSNTWFGSLTEGELCYWISSSAARQIEPDPWQPPYLAICSVTIHNHSEDDLKVERICMRVNNLALFEHQGQLWSDVMEAHYRGGPEISEVRPTGRVPSNASGAKKICPPRQPLKEALVAKTFRTLRSLPGLLSGE